MSDRAVANDGVSRSVTWVVIVWQAITRPSDRCDGPFVVAGLLDRPRPAGWWAQHQRVQASDWTTSMFRHRTGTPDAWIGNVASRPRMERVIVGQGRARVRNIRNPEASVTDCRAILPLHGEVDEQSLYSLSDHKLGPAADAV